MTTALPALVVHDGDEHGVARSARRIALAVEQAIGRSIAVPVDDLTDAATAPPRAHLHFTDRLWAASPEEAAERIECLARRTRLSVTLHDLPQPSDGERNLRRRSDCYARVVRAACGVVVNSGHEETLLREHTAPSCGPVEVIPLAVTVSPAPAVIPPADGLVGVLGYFYPGKGHAEVVEAVARLHRVGMVVLGRASDGHERELDAFVADAERRGVPVEVTGWLHDAELVERCRRVAVPVAAHRHVSASGSVATWIEAGRRPLVPRNRYFSEMSERRPGTVTLVEPDDLGRAVLRALVDPPSTWIDGEAVTRPDLDDTAAAYLAWFRTGVP